MRSRGFLGRLVRKPLAAVSLVVLALIVLATIFAGWLAPYSPDHQDLVHAFSGPSKDHWLGSGVLGKDVLSRLLHGGRVTLVGVLISVSIYALVGTAAGVVAGYRGGWVDRLILRVADVVYAVPAIIVLLVVLAVFPNDETFAMIALGLLGAPSLARIVRSVTLGLRRELYVRAAQAAGLSGRTIMRRHVLPGLAGPIIVQLSLFGSAAVMLETGLGFLGLGVDKATWGTLVAEASKNLGVQPWLLVPSGGLIVIFTLALGLIGDAARDANAERYAANPTRSRRERRPQPVVSAVDGSAPDPTALLSVRGLHVAFPVDGADVTVVQNVSFDVRPGEALGVVGESGCGKTVTATAVLGLLRGGGRITAGSVWFDGSDLATASEDQLRAVRGGRIGWISQDPIAGLDPSFTVGSQVAEAVRAHRSCTRREARARTLELLTAVRLPHPERVARQYPHQLSGGMAQRVGIAAALAGDPAMVIADEPTTALDVTVQAEILDLLRSLQLGGTAVLLVTHDWGVLADLCDRAIVMYAGEVVETAGVADMVDRPGHPYTAGLLRANPFAAVRGEPLPQIDGVVPAPADWPVGCHFHDRCPIGTDECTTGPIAPARVDGRADHRADHRADNRADHGADHWARCLRTADVARSRAAPVAVSTPGDRSLVAEGTR